MSHLLDHSDQVQSREAAKVSDRVDQRDRTTEVENE